MRFAVSLSAVLLLLAPLCLADAAARVSTPGYTQVMTALRAHESAGRFDLAHSALRAYSDRVIAGAAPWLVAEIDQRRTHYEHVLTLPDSTRSALAAYTANLDSSLVVLRYRGMLEAESRLSHPGAPWPMASPFPAHLLSDAYECSIRVAFLKRDFRRADRLIRTCRSLLEVRLGKSHPATLGADLLKAEGSWLEDDTDQASKIARDAASKLSRALGPSSQTTVSAIDIAIQLSVEAGRVDDAARLLAESGIRAAWVDRHCTPVIRAGHLAALGSLAEAYSDYGGAESYLLRALTVLRTAGEAHARIYGEVLLSLSDLFQKVSEFYRGEQYALAALNSARTYSGAESERAAYALTILGNLYSSAGAHGPALMVYAEALRIAAVPQLCRPTLALALETNISSVLPGLKRYQQALDLQNAVLSEHREIRARGGSTDSTSLLVHIGVSHCRLGALTEGDHYFEVAAGLLRERNAGTRRLASIYRNRGVVAYLQGRTQDAESFLWLAKGCYDTNAINLGHGITRTISRSDPYPILAANALAQKDSIAAWAFHEVGLGQRSLPPDRRGADANTCTPAQERAAAGRELTGANVALTILDRDHAVLTGSTILDSLRACLEPDEAIVGWLDIDVQALRKECHGYVIRRATGLRWVHCPVPQWRWIDSLQTALATYPNQRTAEQAAGLTPWRERLWNERLQPLTPHLEGATHLIVVSGGESAGIPYDAAILPDGVTLIDRYTSSYTPCARFLIASKTPRFSQGASCDSALIVGGLRDAIARSDSTREAFESDHGVNSLLHLSRIPGSCGESSSYVTTRDLRSILSKGDANTALCGYLGLCADSSLSGQLQAILSRIADADRDLEGIDWPGPPQSRLQPVLLGIPFELGNIRHSLSDRSLLEPGSTNRRDFLMNLIRTKELGSICLLHVAAHSKIYETAPEFSYIDLGLGADGFASPGDSISVLRLKDLEDGVCLNASCVTFSTCSSASGRRARTEGDLGFVQALIRSGAKNVVGALWDVDDAATAFLMARFYDRLVALPEAGVGELNPVAESLRSAKLWLRGLSQDQAFGLFESLGDPADGSSLIAETTPADPASSDPDSPYRDPFFWASFSVFGYGK